MSTAMVRICDRCGHMVQPDDRHELERSEDGKRYDLCSRCVGMALGPLVRRGRACLLPYDDRAR